MLLFPIFNRISPGGQLLLLLILLIFFALLSTALAYLVSVLIWGKTVMSGLSVESMDLSMLQLFQMLNQVGIFIIPVLLMAWLSERNPVSFLGFRKPRPLHLLASVLMIGVAGPMINQLVTWNEAMTLPQALNFVEEWMRNSEDTATRLTERFLESDDVGTLVINIIMMGLLPAIGEELMFRSGLIGILRKKFRGIHAPVIISSVIFSAFHLQFFGFVPRLVLGLMLGYLFVWSGSVWLPMLAHFINNTTVVMVSWLFANQYTSYSANEFGQSDANWIILLSFAFTFGVLWMVYLTRQKIIPSYSFKESIIEVEED